MAKLKLEYVGTVSVYQKMKRMEEIYTTRLIEERVQKEGSNCPAFRRKVQREVEEKVQKELADLKERCLIAKNKYIQANGGKDDLEEAKDNFFDFFNQNMGGLGKDLLEAGE